MFQSVWVMTNRHANEQSFLKKHLSIICNFVACQRAINLKKTLVNDL